MDQTTGPHENALPDFSSDLLRGADEIGRFLFGESRSRRRKVYYLTRTSRLPVFRIGSMLCARKSSLLAHFGTQEGKAVRPTSGAERR